MEGLASHQLQNFVGTTDARLTLKTKCVLMAIYEKDGKTILQPLIAEKEAKIIPELFHNKTLEVWLSNGKNNISQFDVGILKYKQVLQSLTKCKQTKSQVCLKNYFKNLVSCEECPLSSNVGENQNGES